MPEPSVFFHEEMLRRSAAALRVAAAALRADGDAQSADELDAAADHNEALAASQAEGVGRPLSGPGRVPSSCTPGRRHHCRGAGDAASRWVHVGRRRRPPT